MACITYHHYLTPFIHNLVSVVQSFLHGLVDTHFLYIKASVDVPVFVWACTLSRFISWSRTAGWDGSTCLPSNGRARLLLKSASASQLPASSEPFLVWSFARRCTQSLHVVPFEYFSRRNCRVSLLSRHPRRNGHSEPTPLSVRVFALLLFSYFSLVHLWSRLSFIWYSSLLSKCKLFIMCLICKRVSPVQDFYLLPLPFRTYKCQAWGSSVGNLLSYRPWFGFCT